MMNVALVGFSLQHLAALNVLITRDYPNCMAVEIERVFDENFNFCLPTLTSSQMYSKAIIIELDGVGIYILTSDNIQKLHNFIGNRIAVLVVRAAESEQWRKATINRTNWHWISSPYNKEMMSERLSKALMLAQYVSNVSTQTEINDSKNDSISNNNVSLYTILSTYFYVQNNRVWYDFLHIIEAKTPQRISIGNHIVCANRSKNILLVQDIEYLMNYCCLLKDNWSFANLFKVEMMGFHAFDKIANQGDNGYQKYALNSILWQIYDCLIPKTIEVKDHSLKLKMRFMPNLPQHTTDEFVKAIIASCLVMPKSFEELVAMRLLNRNEVHRIFLLAILSGFADVEVLAKSFEQQKEVTTTVEPALNQSVQVAKKTGFFRRLLDKLKLTV